MKEEINNCKEFEIGEEWKIYYYLAIIPWIVLAQLDYQP